jgi:WD40 repeat protein
MSCIQREDREWQEGNRAAPPLRQLQKTTYADTDKLGGAKKIVKDHLYSKLEQDSLSESDREAAARIFNYLVTPSGAKIAQSVSDLVGYANENLTGDRSKLDCKPVSELLDKLTTGESRILRRVGSSDQPYEQHYEIFHDVLGQAVLEWRRDYWERKQKEDLEKLKKDVQEILGILPASMRSLSPKEKDIAAECFPYLVHAYSVADLAEQVGCESTQLADLLDKFAENRIVRLVGPPPDKPEDQQYQIFHDLLTPAIMEWRRAYLERKKQQERKRKQRRRQSIAIVVGIGVIALVGWQGRIAYQAKVDLVTAESRQVLEKFDAGQQLVALQQGMRSGRWTETWVKNNPLSSIFLSQDKKRQLLSQSTFALQQTLARIQEQNQFSDPSAQLQCWNFSRDGQTLAIGSADGTVQLWNLQTGSKLTSFRASGQLLDLGFSPDGRTLATISADGTVQRWDWRTGKEQARFPTSGSIWTLHFSPSSPVLAIALADGTVQLWNWQTGSQLTSFKASEQVFALRFSPSSPVLAIALADGTVQLWNWETDTTQIAFKASGPVSSLRFSRDSDGQTLAAITRGRTVQLWNPQKGPTPFNKPGRVESLSLNSNGQILAAGSSDGTVQLWDWQTGQKHGQFKASGPVNYLYFGPDDQSLVTVLADGTLSLWALSKGEWQTLPKSSGRVFDLSFSPNGQILATAAPVEGKVQLWDWKTGKLQTELPADRALSLSFSPDGQTLATGSADGTIQVWDWKTRKERAKLKASSPVRSLNFSSDGKTLTTFSVDGTVQLWNWKTGKEGSNFNVSGLVLSLSFSPDGRTLATGSADGTVQLWNWKTGKEGSNFNVSGLVLSLGFSPDGQTLATGSADGTVQLGDWQANKQLNSFSIGSGAVSSLSFSPDGRTLAIASGDGAILSDLNGNQLAQFKTAGYVLGLRFSRDGKTLATTSSEGIVNLWPVEDFVKDLDDLLVRGCKWLRPYLESHPDEGKDLPCQRK